MSNLDNLLKQLFFGQPQQISDILKNIDNHYSSKISLQRIIACRDALKSEIKSLKIILQNSEYFKPDQPLKLSVKITLNHLQTINGYQVALVNKELVEPSSFVSIITKPKLIIQIDHQTSIVNLTEQLSLCDRDDLPVFYNTIVRKNILTDSIDASFTFDITLTDQFLSKIQNRRVKHSKIMNQSERSIIELYLEMTKKIILLWQQQLYKPLQSTKLIDSDSAFQQDTQSMALKLRYKNLTNQKLQNTRPRLEKQLENVNNILAKLEQSHKQLIEVTMFLKQIENEMIRITLISETEARIILSKGSITQSLNLEKNQTVKYLIQMEKSDKIYYQHKLDSVYNYTKNLPLDVLMNTQHFCLPQKCTIQGNAVNFDLVYTLKNSLRIAVLEESRKTLLAKLEMNREAQIEAYEGSVRLSKYRSCQEFANQKNISDLQVGLTDYNSTCQGGLHQQSYSVITSAKLPHLNSYIQNLGEQRQVNEREIYTNVPNAAMKSDGHQYASSFSNNTNSISPGIVSKSLHNEQKFIVLQQQSNVIPNLLNLVISWQGCG